MVERLLASPAGARPRTWSGGASGVRRRGFTPWRLFTGPPRRETPAGYAYSWPSQGT